MPIEKAAASLRLVYNPKSWRSKQVKAILTSFGASFWIEYLIPFVQDEAWMRTSMKATIPLISLALFSIALNGQAAVISTLRTDIAIVGSGISGLCAALEAARAGADVTVIDMGSVFGGHAVMSSGMVCMVGTPEQRASHVADSVELASRDFVQFGEDANANWVRLYAKSSRREVYDWLHELGVTDWELYPQVIPGNSVRRQHVAKGRGVGLVSPIYRECLRYQNLSFVWNTKVTGL